MLNMWQLYAILYINLILQLGLNVAEAKPAVHFGRCKNTRVSEGFCRSADDCSTISPTQRNDENLMQDLKCGSNSNDLICCPVNFLPDNEKKFTISPSQVLPQPPQCGRVIPDNRIFGGQETAIDEFPWMAIIIYSDENSLCGGTLIASEWVLTAAHCVHELDVRAVRLGDWNIATNPDCQESRLGGHDCAPSYIEIPVGITRTHPDYQARANYANDIGLLHLLVSVRFTDWIHPICLPTPASTDSDVNTLAGVSMQIAGWGRTENSYRGSSHMLKAPVSVWLKETCQNVFGQLRLHERQICAGNTTGSCRGDSGGPMMQRKNRRMYQIGVISLGGNCKAQNQPVIFTKVDYYINWIAETMEDLSNDIIIRRFL